MFKAKVFITLIVFQIFLGLKGFALSPAEECYEKAEKSGISNKAQAIVNCISTHAASISYETCLQLSKRSPNFNTTNKTRRMCKDDIAAAKDITIDQCLTSARSMTNFNSQNSERFDCLERFKETITFSKCLDAAAHMTNFADKNRGRNICIRDIAAAKSISFDECRTVASYMSNINARYAANKFCVKNFNGKMTLKECMESADSAALEENLSVQKYCEIHALSDQPQNKAKESERRQSSETIK